MNRGKSGQARSSPARMIGVRSAVMIAGCSVIGGCDPTMEVKPRSDAGIEVRGDTVVRFGETPIHGDGGQFVLDLAVGMIDGPPAYVFGRVSDVAFSAGGGFLVLDGQAQVVREYDANGEYTRDIATRGAGPGEIERASMLAVAADGTIYVIEGARQTIHKYSSTGVFDATWRIGRMIGSPVIIDTAGRLYARLPGPARNPATRFSELAAVETGRPLPISAIRSLACGAASTVLRFSRTSGLSFRSSMISFWVR